MCWLFTSTVKAWLNYYRQWPNEKGFINKTASGNMHPEVCFLGGRGGGMVNERLVTSDPVMDVFLSRDAANTRCSAAAFHLWPVSKHCRSCDTTMVEFVKQTSGQQMHYLCHLCFSFSMIVFGILNAHNMYPHFPNHSKMWIRTFPPACMNLPPYFLGWWNIAKSAPHLHFVYISIEKINIARNKSADVSKHPSQIYRSTIIYHIVKKIVTANALEILKLCCPFRLSTVYE